MEIPFGRKKRRAVTFSELIDEIALFFTSMLALALLA